MLEALAIGSMVGGTALSAYGSIQQGKIADEMYQFNRSVALMYGKAVREMRNWEITQFLTEAGKVYPAQKVAVAHSNLEESGTPLSVMKTTKRKLEEQAALMHTERDMEIFSIEAGAELSSMRGDLAKDASYWDAGSTILTGAGQLSLYGYQQGWGK
jgi:hypothetical protein